MVSLPEKTRGASHLGARQAKPAALLVVAAVTAGAPAATIQVPADRPTIRAALETAVAGDTVRVAPGVYDENVTMKPGVALVGAGPDDTVIDGGGRGSVVVAEDLGQSASLEGFTVTGGMADNGGGMRNVRSSPTVTNCVFKRNVASSYGGGMFNDDSSPTLVDCTFVENSAVKANAGGGGIYNVNNSGPTLENCTFSGNTAFAGFGGGMANSGTSMPVLVNVTFSENMAAAGGAIRNDTGSDAKLSRVTFSANQADHTGGAIENVDSDPTIRECTFSANVAGRGGAIFNDGSDPQVEACTFSANKAGSFGPSGPLNVLAGGFGLIFAGLSLVAVLTLCRRRRLLFAVLVPLVFVIGAGTEFLEAVGGAWWAPDWLLLTRAVCGSALVVMFIWYLRLYQSEPVQPP